MVWVILFAFLRRTRSLVNNEDEFKQELSNVDACPIRFLKDKKKVDHFSKLCDAVEESIQSQKEIKRARKLTLKIKKKKAKHQAFMQLMRSCRNEHQSVVDGASQSNSSYSRHTIASQSIMEDDVDDEDSSGIDSHEKTGIAGLLKVNGELEGVQEYIPLSIDISEDNKEESMKPFSSTSPSGGTTPRKLPKDLLLKFSGGAVNSLETQAFHSKVPVKNSQLPHPRSYIIPQTAPKRTISGSSYPVP